MHEATFMKSCLLNVVRLIENVKEVLFLCVAGGEVVDGIAKDIAATALLADGESGIFFQTLFM